MKKRNFVDMPLNDWIDKTLLKSIAGGIILGIVAAGVRSHRERDGFKPFVGRLLVGGGMGGFFSYMLSDTELNKIVYGLIMFAVGFGGSEIGAIIFSSSKKVASEHTGIDLTGDEPQNRNDEHSPTDQPAS